MPTKGFDRIRRGRCPHRPAGRSTPHPPLTRSPFSSRRRLAGERCSPLQKRIRGFHKGEVQERFVCSNRIVPLPPLVVGGVRGTYEKFPGGSLHTFSPVRKYDRSPLTPHPTSLSLGHLPPRALTVRKPHSGNGQLVLKEKVLDRPGGRSLQGVPLPKGEPRSFCILLYAFLISPCFA